MNLLNKHILLIPDLYEGNGSGAVVTQVLVHLFKKKEYNVAVMSSEFKEYKIIDNVECFPCPPFVGSANIRSKRYLLAFRSILDTFRPSKLFFVGSITNKPLCYLEEGLRRKCNISVFIFMQDFFCAKFYANDAISPCTKCLDEGLMAVFRSNCGVKDIGYLKLVERCRIRYKLKSLLTKVNHLGTSTDEQCVFYSKIGVPQSKIFKLPLPFDGSRFTDVSSVRGDYFVGIAQNRIEKGFHLMPDILKYTKAKVILAYYNDEAVKININNPRLLPFIEKGQLQLVASSWKTGLGDLISQSQGVIIPSIWPTTTEYGWLEALALSKPTITFDIGAHHENIENRINGFTSPIRDYRAMGENIDYVDAMSVEEYDNLVVNVCKLYKRLTDQRGWEAFIDNVNS